MQRRRIVGGALDFGPVRAELGVPDDFPPEVVQAAEEAAGRPRLPTVDATDLALLTVDPPGSRDLDQAFHIAARPAGGFRLSYAIADVSAFVEPGDAIDIEARGRGETLYAPNGRTPLHPPVLGEGAASLLAGQERPALLWTIDLDGDGAIDAYDLRRAMVRSRAQLDYPTLQRAIDGGAPPPGAELLATVGRLRQARALDRGAIELGLPDQEVVAVDSTWTVAYRAPLPVEGWNAQLSLLTGTVAARLMLDAGIGILRTLPPADAASVERLRQVAKGLGVDWPAGASPGRIVAAVDPAEPRHAAFLEVAAELLRGAGYTAFDGALPAQPEHAGIGGPYAHVTAPIRRLVDRFGSEVCVAACAATEVPDWVRSALPVLPALMAASTSRARALERANLDLVEAWILQDRVGERFDAAVVESGATRGMVVLSDPAVRARCDGANLPLGERIVVRLTEADPSTRTVRFVPE